MHPSILRRLSLIRCDFFRSLAPFRLGRAGAVALVTAFCTPILVMIVGFVVDFGYASYINQRLTRAADDATVGSVSQTAATAAGGYGDVSFMQSMGVKYFNANIAQLGATGVNFSLAVVSDGSGGVNATGTYSYNVPTFFAGVLGFNYITVSGTAKTSFRPAVYANYYIVVDVSQSMGIAATQSDMNVLYNRVVAAGNWSKTAYPGCVFGCHVAQQRTNAGGVTSMQPKTNEDLAHDPSLGPAVTLRIDAVVAAIQNIIGIAASTAGTTKNIKFSLYVIQQDPNTGNVISQIASLSTNYSYLSSTAAPTIGLGDNDKFGDGDSDFTDEIAMFNTRLTQNGILTNGSGASATSPVNYVFIVTDGLTDVPGSCPTATNRCTSAMNPLSCLPLKIKATVATIYTTYAPIYNANNQGSGPYDSDYISLVKNLTTPVDTLQQALQSCATSSAYAVQANTGPEIIAAMQSLFQQTQPASARITQ